MGFKCAKNVQRVDSEYVPNLNWMFSAFLPIWHTHTMFAKHLGRRVGHQSIFLTAPKEAWSMFSQSSKSNTANRNNACIKEFTFYNTYPRPQPAISKPCGCPCAGCLHKTSWRSSQWPRRYPANIRRPRHHVRCMFTTRISCRKS